MTISRRDHEALKRRMSEIGRPKMSKNEILSSVLALYNERNNSDVSYPFPLTARVDYVQNLVGRWVSEDSKYLERVILHKVTPEGGVDPLTERVNTGRQLLTELERQSVVRVLKVSDSDDYCCG